MRNRVPRILVSLLLVAGLVCSAFELLGCDLQPWEGEHAVVQDAAGLDIPGSTLPLHAGPVHCTQCVHSFAPLTASPWSVIVTDAREAAPAFPDRPTSITATPPVRPPSA